MFQILGEEINKYIPPTYYILSLKRDATSREEVFESQLPETQITYDFRSVEAAYTCPSSCGYQIVNIVAMVT
jgi:hypothetical protein